MGQPAFKYLYVAACLFSAASLVHAQGTPPTITQQPQSVSVSLGANVTFRVTASGSAPLTYQWLHNGAIVDNATNATLLLGNVVLSAAGSYWVTVSNAVNSVTSQTALLNIDPTFTKNHHRPGGDGRWRFVGRCLG